MKSFETILAEQCAPTLAGIKPASLFCRKSLKMAELSQWRKTLSSFGMEFRVLRACPAAGNFLIYLFRTAWLHEILNDWSIRSFLTRMGYPDADSGALLRHLSQKLQFSTDFPHEIGIFLGYPLEDVTGFMKYRGQNYTYCGCWKVYGNPEEAKRRFAEYHRCTAFYCESVRAGVPLTSLLAAA
ncbi:MAG: DUF3793 family protein [Oscillibacter sp.]|nr:DUF3793 family protein [Oscillibacter sp.]